MGYDTCSHPDLWNTPSARDRTTQTTPERTSKLIRRPTSTCRHSRRFVAGASSRHESLLPKGKTFLTVAEETRAHVQLVVASCWCEPPHKRKRASNDLHPPTQRHAKTQSGRQSSHKLAHGPRNDNHNRTCRKIRIDNSQLGVELGLRCASLIPRTHTTPHTSCASCPSANSMFHSHREGVVPQHIRIERQHATRPQKIHKTCQHTRTHNKQAAICHLRTISM